MTNALVVQAGSISGVMVLGLRPCQTLAIAGGAAVIVTKNVRDFRGAELQFPGLRIMSPGDLLKEI
jgi:hypothetical protein